MPTISLDTWYLVGLSQLKPTMENYKRRLPASVWNLTMTNKLRLNTSALSPFFLAPTDFVPPTQIYSIKRSRIRP